MQRNKLCRKCGQHKPATAQHFYVCRGTRDGFYPWCKPCARTYGRRYYEANKKRMLQKNRDYREANRALLSQQSRRYYEANKERILQQRKRYREANKGKVQAVIREWQKRNREKVLQHCARRNAHKRDLPATLTIEQWRQCKKHFNHSCAYCGRAMKRLTQEHFVPISSGGNYTVGNIIPACSKCNSSKRDKSFFEWYPQQKFYSRMREKRILKYLNYASKGQRQMTIFEAI